MKKIVNRKEGNLHKATRFFINPLNVFLMMIAAFFCACSGNNSTTASYEFSNVRRGTIERTVSSSGTINPIATVRVLPQMSGKVEEVYVDYNDSVTRGTILARLNTDMLRLTRDRQQASVQSSRANYELQQMNYKTQEALAERNLISDYELRQSKTALDNSAANLATAEADLRTTETEINQYAYITAPITGIVLDRNVNVGDTVVGGSNSNSATMFTIAENLREMQIEASVGELDVSSIHKGQDVRFTLESLPGRRFSGVVDNVRMVPVVSGGMVSYTVLISVENRDGSLMPGMTCAVDFIVERSENILLVANAALRYTPTSLNADQISEMVFNASLANMNEEQRQAAVIARTQASQNQNRNQNSSNQGGGIASLMGMGGGTRMMAPQGGAGNTRQTTGQARNAPVMRNLWYVNGEGKLDVVQVLTGISDGSFTEVFLPDDNDGRQFILRERI
ncbi:MAG: efflux RND transporter periplasmic adaptor subunit [Treponema sp.]|jgi:HlyD family secretion protein|nr:efflux RND transporter periplasmic adaptor subunit [Treponema sp.]